MPETLTDRAAAFLREKVAAGLSDATLAILLDVGRHGPSEQVVIAGRCDINRETIRRHVATLVSSGHLDRQPDATDRRLVLLALSAHGRRLVDRLARTLNSSDAAR